MFSSNVYRLRKDNCRLANSSSSFVVLKNYICGIKGIIFLEMMTLGWVIIDLVIMNEPFFIEVFYIPCNGPLQTDFKGTVNPYFKIIVIAQFFLKQEYSLNKQDIYFVEFVSERIIFVSIRADKFRFQINTPGFLQGEDEL